MSDFDFSQATDCLDSSAFRADAETPSKPMSALRCALVQIGTHIGDFAATEDELVRCCSLAAEREADIVLIPHMALPGWPLRSLAQRDVFVNASADAIDDFAKKLQDRGLGRLHVLFSSFARVTGSSVSTLAPRIVDCHHGVAAVCSDIDGAITVADIAGVRVGAASISSLDEASLARVRANVKTARIHALAVMGADAFALGRAVERHNLVAHLAKEIGIPVAFVNAVGGKDALIFDGRSFVVAPSGVLRGSAAAFAADMLLWDVDADGSDFAGPLAPDVPAEEQLYRACVMGVRDYARTCGFGGAVLGLSGGIDSALVASIAVDAFGAQNVQAISMPSQYSSDGSKDDARDLAERTGCHYAVEPIEAVFTTIQNQLKLEGVAAENLQARIRGVIVMSYSNARGLLALETGNKSEDACGYCTMYGDTVGGYAPIRDLLKTQVWALARWRDDYAREHGQVEPIPQNSIVKPPSAELRPGQKDTDSLPDYASLDKTLEAYVREGLSADQMRARGCDSQAVDAVVRLVNRAEWKRRQCPLGPRLSDWAFGDDRSYPLASKWAER